MKEKKEEPVEKKKFKKKDEGPITKEEKRKGLLIKIFGLLFALVVGAIILLVKKNVVISLIGSFIFLGLFFLFIHFKNSLQASAKIKRMEECFPDFLQLVSSNLRAGITVDKSILLSARKEFKPLDKEIMSVGKDITTGKSMEYALLSMGKRIKSEKISKTIILINSGLRSGGNIAVLLEQTASNLREREFVSKRAASNVLMYVIFIFIAVAVGAPALFSLSTILVQAMIGMMSSTPDLSGTVSNLNVPFSFSNVSISLNFLIYFSLTFIIVINILASLILGLVSKGEEKAGLKYLPAMLAIALSTFLIIRYLLSGFISKLF